MRILTPFPHRMVCYSGKRTGVLVNYPNCFFVVVETKLRWEECSTKSIQTNTDKNGMRLYFLGISAK